MRKIQPHGGSIHLNGIDDHTVRDLSLIQAGAYVRTQAGPVILIVNQGAHMPDGKTILSPGQMEHFGWTIDDKSPALNGGTASISSIEGYKMPLTFRHGLAYLRLRPYTDEEWKSLPKVFATSPDEWDPRCLDTNVSDDWYSSQPPSEYFLETDYDAHGNLKAERPHIGPDHDEDNDAIQGFQATRDELRAYATELIAPELATARSAYILTRKQMLRSKEPLVSALTSPRRPRRDSSRPPSLPSASPDGELDQSTKLSPGSKSSSQMKD